MSYYLWNIILLKNWKSGKYYTNFCKLKFIQIGEKRNWSGLEKTQNTDTKYKIFL